jgi:hypothetical protein
MSCDHSPCGCAATDGGYCGAECRTMASGKVPMTTDPSRADCGCGHPACVIDVPSA